MLQRDRLGTLGIGLLADISASWHQFSSSYLPSTPTATRLPGEAPCHLDITYGMDRRMLHIVAAAAVDMRHVSAVAGMVIVFSAKSCMLLCAHMPKGRAGFAVCTDPQASRRIRLALRSEHLTPVAPCMDRRTAPSGSTRAQYRLREERESKLGVPT